MSKNTNLSFLTDYITADITNGRIGINNASPTVAFDVSGATKISGALTLTGALSGTSATFSSSIYASRALFDSDFLSNETSKVGISFASGYGQINSWGANTSTYGGLKFQLSVSNGGTVTPLIITPAGNVGIGTTSPSAKLQVEGYGTANSIMTYVCAKFYGFGSGGINIGTDGTNPQIATDSSGVDLTFLTRVAGTFYERMRITSGGNVGIGTTTPSGWALSLGAIGSNGGLNISVGVPTLVANFNNTSNNPVNVRWNNFNGNFYDIANNPSDNSYTIDYNDTTRFTISSNGSIGAPSGTNIYNASDARLKKNISTTTYGLDTISALNPVKFNWVDGFEPNEDGKDMLGFIAQEVQQVIPEAIESFGENSITIGNTEIDNPIRVNEKFIIPVLVKAIQELKAEIEILKQK